MGFARRQWLQVLSYTFGASVLMPEMGLAAQSGAQTGSPAGTAKGDDAGREKVAGIGGLFFRAHDPKALGLWYEQNLGIALMPTSEGATVWRQEAGPTVFAPFPETTKYFGDPQKMWMVNFRVHNLEKLAAQLQAAGIEVKLSPADATGQFAHLHDPEGNPIELWQPTHA